MYTIAVVNEKGGTGKTTTAVNLSAALGEAGQRVLLVDLDGQAASSRWLGVEEDTSFAEALYAGKGLRPLPSVLPNVSLAPASGKLDAVAHDLRPTQGGQLRRLLAEIADQFDFVIIDCPPSLGNRLIGNALIAATHAIVPVETSILALDGLKILLTTLDDVRDGFGHEIILAGVVACRFDGRTRLSRLVLSELRRALPGRVFETVIRENVRMRECPASGQSILTYAGDSHAAEDYRKLAQELIASPWLKCRPQDSNDAAGTAAFFAAEKDARIGDSLRQTVRGAARDAETLDAADTEHLRRQLEEARQRLAEEEAAAAHDAAAAGSVLDAATFEEAPTADAAAEPPGQVANAAQSAPPGPAIWIDPSITKPPPAFAPPAAAAETVAGQGWTDTRIEPEAPAPAPPPAADRWDAPATAVAQTTQSPVEEPAVVPSADGQNASAPAAAVESWVDLITGAEQPSPPADLAAQLAPPAAAESGDCPNLRKYLEKLQVKQGDQPASVAPPTARPPKKGLLGRLFGRSR